MARGTTKSVTSDAASTTTGGGSPVRKGKLFRLWGLLSSSRKTQENSFSPITSVTSPDDITSSTFTASPLRQQQQPGPDATAQPEPEPDLSIIYDQPPQPQITLNDLPPVVIRTVTPPPQTPSSVVVQPTVPEPVIPSFIPSSTLPPVYTTTATGITAIDKVKSFLPDALTDRTATELYLLAYNVGTALLWTYLLTLVATHLFSSVPPKSPLNPAPIPSSSTASGWLASLFAPKKKTIIPPAVVKNPKWTNFVAKASNTYYAKGIGLYALLVQSLAVLEIVHSSLGLTKSPLKTTAMQVASRLLVVWFWVEKNESVRLYSFLLFRKELTGNS